MHPQFDCDLIAKQQAERIKELEAAMPLYDELLIRCAIAEKELDVLRQRIADAPVVGKVHWFQRFDMDCVVHTEVTWMASPPPHGTKLISKEDLQK